MKKTTNLWRTFAVMCILILAGAMSASAVTIYSTFGPPREAGSPAQSEFGSYSYTSAYDVGHEEYPDPDGQRPLSYFFLFPQFTVPGAIGQRVNVTSVNAAFEWGPGVLQIAADNGGTLGAIIGTLPQTDRYYELETFAPSGGLWLTAGSTYWLMTPYSPTYTAAWNFSDPEVTGTMYTEWAQWDGESLNYGSGTGLGTMPAFQINGDYSVPDGDTYVSVLGAAVMTGLIAFRSRLEKQIPS